MVRPKIDISHVLNGRVRDYADANDLSPEEAYEKVIKTGIEELETNDDSSDDPAD